MTAPTWLILAVPAAAYAVFLTVRAVRRRRADRALAAGIAERVHDRAYLEWLDGEFRAMDAGERP